MKANYILTPDTFGVFIKRFEKLLSATGMLVSQSVYTGRKNLAATLNKSGIKGVINPVTKTVPSYIDKDTVRYDSYPSGKKIGAGEGIIIRINSDSCAVIYWNQKIKWRPNQLVLLGQPRMEKYINCGFRTTYKICHEVEKGKNSNILDEKMAAAYWADVEADYMNEL